MVEVINDIDEWLWGGGYYEQDRAYHLPPLEPIQYRVECAGCGGPVPPDDHVAYDGLPYHNRCLGGLFTLINIFGAKA